MIRRAIQPVRSLMCIALAACPAQGGAPDTDSDVTESDTDTDTPVETDLPRSFIDLFDECLEYFPADEYTIVGSRSPAGVETAPFLHGGTVRVDASRIEVRFVRDGRTHRLVYAYTGVEDSLTDSRGWCDP